MQIESITKTWTYSS